MHMIFLEPRVFVVELNRSLRMPLKRYPATAPVASLVGALAEDGAVVVSDLLDAATVHRLNADLDPFVHATGTARPFMSTGVARFYGRHTRHVTALPARSRLFAEQVLCHPLLNAVADAVLLPSCVRYQLNLAHLFDRGPGAKRQLVHRDQQVWPELGLQGREVELSMVIALVDFDEHNGATQVVPGSHRWSSRRQAGDDELVTAVMQAGSAVLYLGSTLHCGGANRTASVWRRGVHMSFVVGWLRAEENHFLSTPPAIARTLPPLAQALLGYAVHNAEAVGGGYLGSLDLQDPMVLMEQGVI